MEWIGKTRSERYTVAIKRIIGVMKSAAKFGRWQHQMLTYYKRLHFSTGRRRPLHFSKLTVGCIILHTRKNKYMKVNGRMINLLFMTSALDKGLWSTSVPLNSGWESLTYACRSHVNRIFFKCILSYFEGSRYFTNKTRRHEQIVFKINTIFCWKPSFIEK